MNLPTASRFIPAEAEDSFMIASRMDEHESVADVYSDLPRVHDPRQALEWCCHESDVRLVGVRDDRVGAEGQREGFALALPGPVDERELRVAHAAVQNMPDLPTALHIPPGRTWRTSEQ